MFKTLISHSLGEIACNILFSKLTANLSLPNISLFKVGTRYSRAIRTVSTSSNKYVYHNVLVGHSDSYGLVLWYDHMMSYFDITTQEGKIGKYMKMSFGKNEIVSDDGQLVVMKSINTSKQMALIEWSDISEYEFVK